MLPTLIAGLIGVLVSQAEKLLSGPSRGAEKKAWVVQMVHEFVELFLKWSPDWLDRLVVPSQAALESAISAAIEGAVGKLNEGKVAKT